MKITFIGLSCFLIENEKGFRILVDPFNPSPEWTLGPEFPVEFNGQPFGANIVLMTEPDADHAYAPGDWLSKAPPTKPGSNPFPGLNLRGTVVYEWNGDVNIAWHYTIEGIRLAHFGDNSHVLSDEQLDEIGAPDIVFMAPPKADGTKHPDSLDVIRKNINLLKPKIIVWTHHLAPKGLPELTNRDAVRQFFQEYFKKNASTNQRYKNESSFMELSYCLENAVALGNDYQSEKIENVTFEVSNEYFTQKRDRPVAVLFTTMLAKTILEPSL